MKNRTRFKSRRSRRIAAYKKKKKDEQDEKRMEDIKADLYDPDVELYDDLMESVDAEIRKEEIFGDEKCKELTGKDSEKRQNTIQWSR